MSIDNTIEVLQVLSGDRNPMTDEDGIRLHLEIEKKLKKKQCDQKIVIDFTGIETFTPCFISNSISQYVALDGVDNVSTYLRITGLEDPALKSIANLVLTLTQSMYDSNRENR